MLAQLITTKIAGLALAGTLAVTGGTAAATGHLPDGPQREAHTLFAHVGIELRGPGGTDDNPARQAEAETRDPRADHDVAGVTPVDDSAGRTEASIPATTGPAAEAPAAGDDSTESHRSPGNPAGTGSDQGRSPAVPNPTTPTTATPARHPEAENEAENEVENEHGGQDDPASTTPAPTPAGTHHDDATNSGPGTVETSGHSDGTSGHR
jgi:hypothetical protein